MQNRVKKTKEHVKKHFLKRAQERGLDIVDEKFLDYINAKAKRDKLPDCIRFFSRQSNTRTVYKTFYRDRAFYLVYDKTVKSFSTVLTEEMIEEHKKTGWKYFLRGNRYK